MVRGRKCAFAPSLPLPIPGHPRRPEGLTTNSCERSRKQSSNPGTLFAQGLAWRRAKCRCAPKTFGFSGRAVCSDGFSRYWMKGGWTAEENSPSRQPSVFHPRPIRKRPEGLTTNRSSRMPELFRSQLFVVTASAVLGWMGDGSGKGMCIRWDFLFSSTLHPRRPEGLTTNSYARSRKPVRNPKCSCARFGLTLREKRMCR